MAKSKIPTKDSKLAAIKRKITLVEQFIAASKQIQNNPQEALNMFQAILDQPNVEVRSAQSQQNSTQTSVKDAIRSGDVYGKMVEVHYATRNFDKAFEIIQKMKAKRIQVRIISTPG